MRRKSLFRLIFLVIVASWAGTGFGDVINPGTADPSFNTTNGPSVKLPGLASSIVWSVLPLRSGQVMVGGSFAQVEGTNWPYLARFNRDGSLDPSFTARPNETVRAMIEQPDGRILIAGDFNLVNGQFRDRVARLESNGLLDTNFTVRLGLNGTIYALALQPDGRVLAGGGFHVARQDEPWIRNLIRLETNGAIDFSFDVGSQLRTTNIGLYFVEAVAVQSDGKILAAGSFNSTVGSVRDYIARFHPNGTLDTGFYCAYPFAPTNGPIHALTVGADDLITIGQENAVSFAPRGSVYRLYPSGHRDETFIAPTFANPCHALAVDAGLRTYVVSSALEINTQYNSSRMYRLDATGRPDTDFAVGFPGNFITVNTFAFGIACVAFTEDGQTAIGGSFGAVPLTPFTIFPARRVALLNGDSPGPPTWTTKPTNVITEIGREVVLSAGFRGSLPAWGQWFRDGEVMSGRTNALLFFPSIQSGDAGEYRLVVSNAFGVATSEVAVITIRDLIRPGAVDLSFAPEPGIDNTVLALANAPGNGLYVGGQFSRFNGENVLTLARLTPEGVWDRTFQAGLLSTSSVVRALFQEENGRLLAAGTTLTVHLADGHRDPSFGDVLYQAVGVLPTLPLNAVPYCAVLGDARGRIYLGGSFIRFNDSTAFGGLVRLRPDGILDQTFAAGSPTILIAEALDFQDDGRLVAGGWSYSNSGSDLARFSERAARDATLSFMSWGPCPPNPSSGTLNPWPTQNLTGDCGHIRCLVTQPDGQLVVGGTFTVYSTNGFSCQTCGILQSNLSRITLSGTLDTNFTSHGGVSGAVNAMIQQPDGRLIIGGEFTSVNGVPRNRMARLNLDGTVDPTFDIGEGPNGPVYALLLRPDGKLAVAGRFTRFNGYYRGSVALLHRDRLSVPAVVDPPTNVVTVAGHALKLAPSITGYPLSWFQWFRDGQPITGANTSSLNLYFLSFLDSGNYSLVVSNAAGMTTNLVAVIAVQPQAVQAGAIDASFKAASTDGDVKAICVQPDGRILIGGQFQTVSGVRRAGVARLLADGTVDFTFNPGSGLSELPSAGITLDNIALQSDGRVLVTGRFDRFNDIGRSGLARLDSNGALDLTFNVTGTVSRVAVQSDGKILVAGHFTQLNGWSTTNLGRFHADGSIDETFRSKLNPGSQVLSMAIEAAGTILVAGQSIGGSGLPLVRLNSDGSFNKWLGNLDGSVDYPASDVCFPAALGGISPPIVLVTTTQRDGAMVVGGVFEWPSTSRKNIARLDPAGRVDPLFGKTSNLFYDSPNFAVRAIALQSDGSLIIGGCFTNIQRTNQLHLARLKTNGLLDPLFNPAVGYRDRSGYVNAIAIQSDGRILIGGQFSHVDGVRRDNLVRLGGDVLLFDPVADGTRFTTKISTIRGRRYFLETRPDLDDGAWELVAEEFGDGTVRTFAHGGNTREGRRYFRIRVE
jgi:uncharacterized delta-60 repeat protein